MEKDQLDHYKLVRNDEMKMRWGEMDALAHMNNVAYIRYFEEARVAWFYELDISYDSKSEGPILGTINCRYLHAAIYPVQFLMRTYVGDLGTSSFKMYQELCNQNDRSVDFAQCSTTMVWADIAEGKSRPIPDWLRSLIQTR